MTLRFVWEERPVGVEPTLPPWQGSRLPLHHGRVLLLIGAGGIRTLAVQVKSLLCCRYTTTPFG